MQIWIKRSQKALSLNRAILLEEWTHQNCQFTKRVEVRHRKTSRLCQVLCKLHQLAPLLEDHPYQVVHLLDTPTLISQVLKRIGKF